jgi:indolepyruvate ferredoxin oxidoreductase alpha subunit
MSTPITAGPGERVLLMGNEAIARGAIEAGLEVATAYPGTPSSEVVEALYAASPEFGYYVEWSTNEKVAFEVAFGAATVGAKSLVAMKNAGLNVAMDTFMTVPYGGTKGGFLIVVADDPDAHYSSTEQDTRVLAEYAEIPCFEPRDQQEAKDMARAAFELSEKLELPVMLRSVTRISHASGDVTLAEVTPQRKKLGFNKHWKMQYRWNVYGAPGAVHKHTWLHSTFPAQKRASESSPFNALTIVDGADVGVIASGIGAAYAQDSLADMGIGDKVSFLKVGFVNPPPEEKIATILKASKRVLLIEEGDPVLERRVLEIARTVAPSVAVYGKRVGEALPPTGEINNDLVKKAIALVCGAPAPRAANEAAREAARAILAPRSSTLCAGCPHLGSYWSIKRALRALPGPHIINGDIGCYEQGGYGIFSHQIEVTDEDSKAYPVRSPYETLDSIYVMGSGIGMAQGQAHAGYKQGKVLAVAGDSTFFHATLPAVANAAVNNSDITFIVFDNSWTAMTGHQPSPRTGLDQIGGKMPTLEILDAARALGMRDVFVASAFDIKQGQETVKQAIAISGPSMVVFTGECALQVQRRTRKTGSSTLVNQDQCTGCKTCLELGCPAVMFDISAKKASIDKTVCNDCGLCEQVCPVHAIANGGKSDVR